MKILVFLLMISANALTLPRFEEVCEVLESGETNRREALTQRIWRSGREAIPLLRKLSKVENPEVFRRALFVLQRLKMGLEPDSPPELLKLAEAVNLAKPEFRATKLVELLDHPEGIKAALVFLDGWVTDSQMQEDQMLRLTELVTKAILERRSWWKIFLSTDLSPRCRGVIIAVLSWEELPMKAQMIANLASEQTKEVFEMSVTLPDQMAIEGYVAMARIATVNGDVALALKILAAGLHQDDSYDLARAIAFLEVGCNLPSITYNGNWAHELNLFRSRARQDFKKTLQLASQPDLDPVLAYESNIIAGALTFPSADDEVDFPASTSLTALHQSFDKSPGEPDIEALTSSVLIDWSELARTLMSLACPLEAAERLSSENQPITATSLLWLTNSREKALSLAKEVLDGPDNPLGNRMRLTLAFLSFEAGDRENAREFFKDVITTGIEQDARLRSALKLAMNFFSRKELIPLASGLMADQAFQRTSSITGLLPYHPKVSTYWYEYFRGKDPTQSPLVIFDEVENFLSNQKEKARSIIADQIAASTKTLFLPTDVIYQQAFFLRISGALEIIETAAWYQLSIDDLLLISRDDSWGIKARKQALATALLIDPTNVVLHHLNLELNHAHLPVALRTPTLGDPGLILQLAAVTGKFETIALASELADLTDHQGVRCLAILGQFHLKGEEPEEAARALQAAICGEVAMSPQPATPIRLSINNLANYFSARRTMSSSSAEKEIWTERLVRIGRN